MSIYGKFSPNLYLPCFHKGPSFSFLTESVIFQGYNHRNGKTIIYLSNINILKGYIRHLKSPFFGTFDCLETCEALLRMIYMEFSKPLPKTHYINRRVFEIFGPLR